MKSMVLTAEERKAEYDGCCAPSTGDSKDEGPRYPYGLSLYFDDVIMKKLGMDPPAVGGEMTLIAKVKITGTSTREYVEGGKTQTRSTTDVQITAMDLSAPAGDVQGRAAKRMYPDAD